MLNWYFVVYQYFIVSMCGGNVHLVVFHFILSLLTFFRTLHLQTDTKNKLKISNYAKDFYPVIIHVMWRVSQC